MEMYIVEKIEEFESTKKWLVKYSPKRQKRLVNYLKIWCKIARKTPDELANTMTIWEDRAKIFDSYTDNQLDVTLKLVNAFLNGFWEANNRAIVDKDGNIDRYAGMSSELRKRLAPKGPTNCSYCPFYVDWQRRRQSEVKITGGELVGTT
jgi:hypothetical protein